MITVKKCPKCKETKNFTKFYKSRFTKDGLHGWCKICCLKGNLRYQQTEGGKEAHQRARQKYDQTPAGKESHRKSTQKIRQDYPQKHKARNTLNNAIRDGKLERLTYCEHCFREGLAEGHHPDYDKPLEVIWLCRGCHTELHNELILA